MKGSADIRKLFMRAVEGDNPVLQLRKTVETTLLEGVPYKSALALLDELFDYYRSEENEESENVVADVMDFLIGWCSPHMKIQPLHAVDLINKTEVKTSQPVGRSSERSNLSVPYKSSKKLSSKKTVLTGKSLLELIRQHPGEKARRLAELAGYVTDTKTGRRRVQITAYQKAKIEAEKSASQSEKDIDLTRK
ncbi:hypothetical protein GKIL_4191 [Gloeobacter kilaueensis JS1]|uniref:Uncharacterized protein n=2 Tax=Gloeobacter TaxID=33071 RepID=U5QN73_GLOK1|nr:hypothetical protein GKIL_4191 [Gloeobacter kilaueensis JS1]